jgi:hypothetical protein
VKNIGYVIVMESRPVKHRDSDPYWLQFSSYCELYRTYNAARNDVRKELRRLKAMRGKVSGKMLDRWEESICIVPVRKKTSGEGRRSDE